MTDHCTNPNCRHRMPHWHHFAPDPDRPGNVISTTHFPHLIEASRSTSVAEDSTSCVHPADAVWWNEYDRVVRCHRCGEVLTDDLTDDQILDVIATELRKGLYSADEAARDILAVLRDAGYDIVPHRHRQTRPGGSNS